MRDFPESAIKLTETQQNQATRLDVLQHTKETNKEHHDSQEFHQLCKPNLCGSPLRVIDLIEKEGNQATKSDVQDNTKGRNNKQFDPQNYNGPFKSTVKGKCQKKEKKLDWTPQ